LTYPRIATCAVIDLALFSRVRDPTALAKVRASRAAAFPWLPTADEDLLRALEVQAWL